MIKMCIFLHMDTYTFVPAFSGTLALLYKSSLTCCFDGPPAPSEEGGLDQ